MVLRPIYHVTLGSLKFVVKSKICSRVALNSQVFTIAGKIPHKFYCFLLYFSPEEVNFSRFRLSKIRLNKNSTHPVYGPHDDISPLYRGVRILYLPPNLSARRALVCQYSKSKNVYVINCHVKGIISNSATMCSIASVSYEPWATAITV